MFCRSSLLEACRCQNCALLPLGGHPELRLRHRVLDREGCRHGCEEGGPAASGGMGAARPWRRLCHMEASEAPQVGSEALGPYFGQSGLRVMRSGRPSLVEPRVSPPPNSLHKPFQKSRSNPKSCDKHFGNHGKSPNSPCKAFRIRVSPISRVTGPLGSRTKPELALDTLSDSG